MKTMLVVAWVLLVVSTVIALLWIPAPALTAPQRLVFSAWLIAACLAILAGLLS